MINLELHETTAISSLPSSAWTLEAKTDEGSATPRLPCSSFPPVRSLISSKNSRCYLPYISLTFYCYIGLSLPWRAVTTSVIHKDVPQSFYPDEHVLDLKNEADPLFEDYFIMNVYFLELFSWHIDKKIMLVDRWYNIPIRHLALLVTKKSLVYEWEMMRNKRGLRPHPSYRRIYQCSSKIFFHKIDQGLEMTTCI